MSVVFNQVVKLSAVPVFLVITRILFSLAQFYCFSEMMFIIYHHMMIERIGNMLPSFLSQVYLIAITICHSPTNCCHILQFQLILMIINKRKKALLLTGGITLNWNLTCLKPIGHLPTFRKPEEATCVKLQAHYI